MSAPNRNSTRTVPSLGKVICETKSSAPNLIAGAIIGVILIVGGLGLTGFMMRQMFFGGGAAPQGADNWIGAIVIALLGVGLAAGGVVLLLWMKSLVGFSLSLCEQGFFIVTKRNEMAFAWDEISQVRESIIVERLPLVKGAARHLMPTKTTRTYTVVRCDGEEFYFDENVLPQPSLLAGPLAVAAKKLRIPWETSGEEPPPEPKITFPN